MYTFYTYTVYIYTYIIHISYLLAVETTYPKSYHAVSPWPPKPSCVASCPSSVAGEREQRQQRTGEKPGEKMGFNGI